MDKIQEDVIKRSYRTLTGVEPDFRDGVTSFIGESVIYCNREVDPRLIVTALRKDAGIARELIIEHYSREEEAKVLEGSLPEGREAEMAEALSKFFASQYWGRS